MKECPILFSGIMVRDVLDGVKTQTRRLAGLEIINKNPDDYEFLTISGYHAAFRQKSTGDEILVRSRYGGVGDTLWVREAFDFYNFNPSRGSVLFSYKEDDSRNQTDLTKDEIEKIKKWKRPVNGTVRGMPGMFLFRSMSRCFRQVTGIRVERLNQIDDEDSRKEGVECDHFILPDGKTFAQIQFSYLWVSIYGCDSWHENPWVWAIEFKEVT